MSGERLLSDQKIWQIVSAKAVTLSQNLQKNVVEALNQTIPKVVRVNPKVDIYDAQAKEILLFDDGIQVKGQKAQRQLKTKSVKEKEGQGVPKQPKTPAVTTDIVLLQKANREFEYIAAPMNGAGEDLLSLASACWQE